MVSAHTRRGEDEDEPVVRVGGDVRSRSRAARARRLREQQQERGGADDGHHCHHRRPAGGTLRVNVSTTDVQSIDPAIDYENTGWAILDATCLKLVNYPDKSGLPGTIVIPEAATALPTVSSDGKTYTFTIRKGFKFNTGEEVTAQTFAHVIDRDLAPALQSPAVTFLSDVVGADAVVEQEGDARVRASPSTATS